MTVSSFMDFLIERKTSENSEIQYSHGAGADAAGKLYELLVGKHLSGTGQHLQHHRVEGKLPEDIHDEMANRVFGIQKGESHIKHPGYKTMDASAKKMAEKLRDHLGLEDKPRVAWTSQPSDHKKETGIEDPNSKADLIANRKHTISVKFGQTDTPNYFNPGLENFEQLSGVKLGHHQENHAKVVKKYGLSGGTKGHQDFKLLRDSKDPAKKAIADQILASAKTRHEGMAKDVRNAFSQKSDQELRDIVRKTVASPTKLKTTVAHAILGNDGKLSQHVYPIEDHVEHYLSQFSGLHTVPSDKGGSVVIHGHYNNPGHPMHGKKMSVWQSPIYAGGRPTGNARGAVTLPSEAHPAVREGISKLFDEINKKKNETPETVKKTPDSPAYINWMKSKKPGVGGKNKGVPEQISSVGKEEKELDSPKPKQQVSPIGIMKKPGIKKPEPSRRIAPNGYPEHMHQAHKENSFGGFQDSGI